MKKYLLLMLLTSGLYSESITVYATQSAQYISDGSNGDSCCTPGTLGYFNASEMSVQSCWSHNVYGNCLQRKHGAIWSFDLSDIPQNANITNLDFLFNQSWEGYSYTINVSTDDGNITNTLASNLYSSPDWYGFAENTPNSLIQIIALPIDEIFNESNINQLNIFIVEDGSYIGNSGLNAPRINIEYETEVLWECIDLEELECATDNSCEWVEDINDVSCSAFSNENCTNQEGCFLDQDCNQWGSWYSWICYDYGPVYCSGNYQQDNSYCEEVSIEYQMGDINGDYIINVLDIIEVINLVLDNEYNYIVDMNNDLDVNVLDIIELVNIILNGEGF